MYPISLKKQKHGENEYFGIQNIRMKKYNCVWTTFYCDKCDVNPDVSSQYQESSTEQLPMRTLTHPKREKSQKMKIKSDRINLGHSY